MMIDKNELTQMITEAADRIDSDECRQALIKDADDFYCRINNYVEQLLTEALYQILNDFLGQYQYKNEGA